MRDCVHMMWRGRVFTCTLVLSCQAGQGGFECGTRDAETHSKILDGPEQTRKALMEEGLQKVQSITESRLFARCCKQMAVQVCTKL
jgi:hypothetical protein